MPTYTFDLRDGERCVADESGISFPDGAQALAHAHEVARELMYARELQTRSWVLGVYEDGARVHEVLFASVDHALDHLRPELRMTVEKASKALRSFKETMSAAQATILETKALISRSLGKPYLVTVGGQPTIGVSQTRRHVIGTENPV